MPNFENRSELILYRYRRIVPAYVIQRNTEHRTHFVSNAWVDRGYGAEKKKIAGHDWMVFFEEPFVHYRSTSPNLPMLTKDAALL